MTNRECHECQDFLQIVKQIVKNLSEMVRGLKSPGLVRKRIHT